MGYANRSKEMQVLNLFACSIEWNARVTGNGSVEVNHSTVIQKDG